MTHAPVVLINVLKVDPSQQQALVSMLQKNIETVITTLDGWKASRLIAALDGASVIIYSEWETVAAVQAMRNDARMKAYFPKLLELARFETTLGEISFEKSC
jgi:quinol monooxygenase YgiN